MIRLRRIAVSIALIGLVVVLTASWVYGSTTVRGQASPVAPSAPPDSDIVIRTEDGIDVAATYRPGRRPDAAGVLLLHGVGGARTQLTSNATWLSGLGYATLAIDFRGHGLSTITDRSFGLTEAADAGAAFAWLKRRQQEAPVAVVGISLGGAASLLGETGPLPADAFVLQAVYPDIRRAIRNRIARLVPSWLAPVLEPLLSFQTVLRHGKLPSRLSPVDRVSRTTGPLLVIGGWQDRETPPEETAELAAAAPGRAQLWMTEGTHGEISWLRSREYRDRLADFLASTIGRP